MTEFERLVSKYAHRRSQTVEENLSIESVLVQIKNGIFQYEIENCRKLLKQKGEDDYAKAKNKLPSFTPSGTFKSQRLANKLDTYSGIIVLDIDKLPSEEIAQDKCNAAANIEYTWAAFVSPSGVGVKILVAVSNGSEHHKESYATLKSCYEQHLCVPIDKSGSDISRLCFFSHDPNLYHNPNAKIFDYTQYQNLLQVANSSNPLPNNAMLSIEKIFISTVKFTENRSRFESGNRNNFILLLAGNFNRRGIPMDAVLPMIIDKYDSAGFEEKEIVITVKSAYRNTAEYGKYGPKWGDDDKKPKKLAEEDTAYILKEMGILLNGVTEDRIIEILLLSSIDSEYESLCKFCQEGLIELFASFGQAHYQQILEEIIKDCPDDKNFWLTHSTKTIQSIATKTFQKNLFDKREEAHRLEICYFKADAFDKLLHQKIFNSRFVNHVELKATFSDVDKYLKKRAYWQKEVEHLIMHLWENQL